YMKTLKNMILVLTIFLSFDQLYSYNEWIDWNEQGIFYQCGDSLLEKIRCTSQQWGSMCKPEEFIASKCSQKKLYCFCKKRKQITNRLDYTIELSMQNCSNRRYILKKNESIFIENVENGHPCPIESITFRGVWLCQFSLLWSNIPDNFVINEIQMF